MPSSLILVLCDTVRSMIRRRNSRRRLRRMNAVDTLESRCLLAAVISPITDFNTNPAGVGFFGGSVQLNDNVVLVSLSTLEYGNELWRTDGTSEGTFRLTDARRGPDNSDPNQLTIVGDSAYFTILAGNQQELWKTDGTIDGTQPVRDSTGQVIAGHFWQLLAAGNSELYFVHQNELWTTNGTPDGTYQLSMFEPTPENLVAIAEVPVSPDTMHTYLVFADSNYSNRTLARYDLATGTLTTLRSHSTLQIHAGYVGRLLYSASDSESGNELWYSDGTPETTRLWMDINPGPADSYPDSFRVDGSEAWFSARSTEHGWEVWRLQDHGTMPQVIDITPGSASSNPSVVTSLETGGRYVMTNAGLYRLTNTGAVQVDPAGHLNSSNSQRRILQGHDGVLYYYDDPFASSFLRLKRTSVGGSTATVRGDFQSFQTFLGTSGRKVLFLADDRIHGTELWSTDGTTDGTSLIRDIETGTAGSNANPLMSLNGELVFTGQKDVVGGIPTYLAQTSGDDAVQTLTLDYGQILHLSGEVAEQLTDGVQWTTRIEINGVVSTAVILWDGERFLLIARLSNSQYMSPVHPVVDLNGVRIVPIDDFSANEPHQLWVANDKGELTQRLAMFNQLALYGRRVVGGKLCFLVHDPTSSAQHLWQTDGTVAGTHPIAGFPRQGNFNSLVFGSRLVITLDDTRRRIAYWNAESGQVSYSDDLFPTNDTRISLLHETATETVFLVNGNQIWSTQGTPDSTRQLLTLQNERTFLALSHSAGSVSYFVTNRIEAGKQIWSLWRTDGTSAGTSRVISLPPSESLDARSLSTVGGRLMFVTRNYDNGTTSVWVSDGTADGTFAIADHLIVSATATFIEYSRGIAFAAATPETGTELYRIDTTINAAPPDGLSIGSHSGNNALSWPDVRGAIQYDVWIRNLSQPAAPAIRRRVNEPRIALTGDAADGLFNPDDAYRVWVRSLPVLGEPSAWSAPRDLVPGMTPALHGIPAESDNTLPTFRWTGPDDVVSYELWVTNRDLKTRPIYLQGLRTDSFSVTTSLPPAKYAAWVRGTRSDGSRTDWSALTEFDILTPAIRLTSGAVLSRTSRPAFSWNALPGADNYEVVIRNADGIVVHSARNVTTTSHTTTVDLVAGRFRVQIRAFKGLRPLSANGGGDALTVILPPTGLQITQSALSWNAVPTAVSYTFELRNAAGALVRPVATGSQTSVALSAPLDPGQYTMRVFASFPAGSSHWSATLNHEVFRPGTAITSSNLPTADATPVISWSGLPLATAYEIRVSNVNGGTIVYNRSAISGTSHRIDKALTTGLHAIQVRGLFPDGSRSVWSSPQQLLIGPAPSLSFAGRKVQWNPVNQATHYELWINFLGSPVQQKIVYAPIYVQTDYVFPSSLPKGRYVIWLRAIRAESGEQYAGAWASREVFVT